MDEIRDLRVPWGPYEGRLIRDLPDDYLDDLLSDEDGLACKENCGRALKKILTAAPVAPRQNRAEEVARRNPMVGLMAGNLSQPGAYRLTPEEYARLTKEEAKAIHILAWHRIQERVDALWPEEVAREESAEEVLRGNRQALSQAADDAEDRIENE